MFGHVAIRAVAFDIGDVLERIDPVECFTQPWRDRLGMSEADFEAALAKVDPDRASRVPSRCSATGWACRPTSWCFLMTCPATSMVCALGIHGIVHVSTPDSIAAVDTLTLQV